MAQAGHLRPQEPGELPGDGGNDNALVVLAGRKMTESRRGGAEPPKSGRRPLGPTPAGVGDPGPDIGPVPIRPGGFDELVRTWMLPALVMWPRRALEPPEEYSAGTSPTKPISVVLGKAAPIAYFGLQADAPQGCHPGRRQGGGRGPEGSLPAQTPVQLDGGELARTARTAR